MMGGRIAARARTLALVGACVELLPWLVCTGAGAAGSAPQRWTEQEFSGKAHALHPHVVIVAKDPNSARTVIGNRRFYYVRKGDTLFDLGRFYDLGYNEVQQANPGVDPWVPPDGHAVLLPTEWVIPDAPAEGLVINIPEMRLYYFYGGSGGSMGLVSTYPVGLGRDDWRTPQGEFRVRGKTESPTWVIPESIRKERIKEKGRMERRILGGDPENPLGAYRIELTLPSYAIHGTNMPWGVGMQVSHGCIRLYPEDIAQFFPMVPVGAAGRFVYQPVKIGARAGRIYAEVHPDIYTLTPGLFREARRIVDELGWAEHVDFQRLQRAVEEQSGVPLDVTAGVQSGTVIEEDLSRMPTGLPREPNG